MHRLIPARCQALLALVLLAGCATPTPAPTVSYRDAGLGLYSNAVLDPARLAGRWHQVAAFANPNSPSCPPGEVVMSPTAAPPGMIAAYDMQARLCLPDLAPAPFLGRAEMPVPGRMQLSGADGQGIGLPWWVIWVDVDYRTMVIGTPSGRFGFILNRDGRLPQDRLTAAREILDWGGYDLSRLRLLDR